MTLSSEFPAIFQRVKASCIEHDPVVVLKYRRTCSVAAASVGGILDGIRLLFATILL